MPLLLLAAGSMVWRSRFLLVSALFALSFIACLLTIGSSPDLAFYSIHTRAWELLAGSLCALWLIRAPVQDSPLLAGLGLAMIVASVLVFDETTPFPSAWTLLPVGGTVLVILFAGSGGYVARLLAWSPVVGIGMISYSVYLWHQPLLAFTRLNAEHEPRGAVLLAAALLSIPLGYLSWRFVEQPFRKGAFASGLGQREIFGATAAATVAMAGIALVYYLSNGLPDRQTPSGQTFAQLQLQDKLAVNPGFDPVCTKGFTLDDRCASGPSPTVLVWGDSYAMHLVGAIRSALPADRTIRQLTLSACGPVPDLTLVASEAEAKACAKFNRQVMDWLETSPGIKDVIISSPFAWMATPSLKVRRPDGTEMQAGPEIAAQALQASIARLKSLGLSVTVVSPPPNPGWDIGRCLANRAKGGGSLDRCDFDRTHISKSVKVANGVIASVSPGHVVWLERFLCPDQKCRASDDGTFLYRDRGHLSNEGSLWLGRQPGFAAALKSGLTAAPQTP